MLELCPRLLVRQVDARASQLFSAHLGNLSIEVVDGTSVAGVLGRSCVTLVSLSDGRTLSSDLCLVAAGIVPNASLATQAGLAVNRGLLVNAQTHVCTACQRRR